MDLFRDDALEIILRGWAKAYRDTPEHRFPSDPNAEFFPIDLEAAADEIERLRKAVDREIDNWKKRNRTACALAKALEDIKQATIEGRVCDDVAWFDEITTLHDFCDTVLAGVNALVASSTEGAA